MARSISHVVLISTLLVIVSMRGSGADWTRELSRSINRMTQDINEQVHRFTQDLHTRIQHQVESSLQPTLEQVERTIQNLPRDAQGHVISTSGSNSVVINSGAGVMKTVLSGRTPDGEPYVRNIEEYHRGNFLYHNETLYNPKTKTTKRIHWKLDLANPDATPESIPDE